MEGAVINLFIGFAVGILVGNNSIRNWVLNKIRKRSDRSVGKSVGNFDKKTGKKQSIDDIISAETNKEMVQWNNPVTRDWVLIEKCGDEAKIVKRMPDAFDNVKVIKKFEVK